VKKFVCDFTWIIKATKSLALAKEHCGAVKRAEQQKGIISRHIAFSFCPQRQKAKPRATNQKR